MPGGLPDAATFIRSNLPLVAVPGAPEIRLHLAVPSSGLHRLLAEDAPCPYWAYRWSGGLALARYLLDQPGSVRGRRVLDLGCGGGIVGIAAAKAGCAQATAIDVDPLAVVAAALNRTANGCDIEVGCADILSGPPPAVDVILAADIFYDEELGRCAGRFLDRCVMAGVEVLVGDPGRAHLPLDRLRRIADYVVAETGDRPDKPAAVFRYATPLTPARGVDDQPSLDRRISAPTARSFSSNRS
jgi:predicted nicotinamide N-methyase